MNAFRLVSIFTLLVIFTGLINAQVLFGIKGGISTYDLGLNEIVRVSNQTGDPRFELTINEARLGYHLGLLFQFQFSSFIIQPEFQYNANTVEFSVNDIVNNNTNLLSEKYQYIDAPLMLGVKAGPLRLLAGPIAHYFLKSKSSLDSLEDYEQNFDKFTYGWQAGIGFDFFNAMLDIRYEGNFNEFGEHMYFSGQSYPFSNKPSRLLASFAVTIQ